MIKLSLIAAALIISGGFEFAVANTQHHADKTTKIYANVTDTIPGKKKSPTTPSPSPSPAPTPSPSPMPTPSPTPTPSPAPTPSPTPTPTPAPPHQ